MQYSSWRDDFLLDRRPMLSYIALQVFVVKIIEELKVTFLMQPTLWIHVLLQLFSYESAAWPVYEGK